MSLTDNYRAMFKAFYPPNFESVRPDPYPDNWPRPLKCEVCGTKVARWGWRKHGNPRCGPHAGLVPFDRMPLLERPFFLTTPRETDDPIPRVY